VTTSPSPPNANRESESLRTRGARFKPLINIHRVKEIGRDKAKMVPNESREITIHNTMEKSLFMSITSRTSRGGAHPSMVD
jgi:hypothetical protein